MQSFNAASHDLNTPSYAEPWLQFKTAAVRQLAFAIASPNLLCAWPHDLIQTHAFAWHADHVWQQHFARYLPRLSQLDQKPEPLLQFLKHCKSTRLGLRFEQLLLFWLQDAAYHPYELLGHRLQQRHGRQTLGELDFLLQNHDTGQIEHWEVALKYYLAEADINIWHWYGLNRQDTLHGKLLHFSQQQFRFTQAEGFNIEQRYAVMKGQLYLPQYWNEAQAAHPVVPLPHWLNPSRRYGVWSYNLPPAAYYRLQRREWLCPDATLSSSHPTWYTDGLYKHAFREHYWMFRIAAMRTPYPPHHQFSV